MKKVIVTMMFSLVLLSAVSCSGEDPFEPVVLKDYGQGLSR
mgnify:CR=1 FL=1